MKLSLVIPCRNEEGSLAETLTRLSSTLDAAVLDYEIVAVDDGSTDGTGGVLRELAARLDARRSMHDDGKGRVEDRSVGHKSEDAIRDTTHDSRPGGQGAAGKVKHASSLVREDGRDVSHDSCLMSPSFSRFRVVTNEGEHGFGMAVRCGLEHITGDAVVIYMADMSDAPEDVVRYARKLEEGFDCVFGSRFMAGGRVVDYPWHKLILNRLANRFIQVLFGIRLNDTTNAFKAYRREVVQGISPLLAKHFNLTVEMPLKAIVRGYRYAVVPISWTNRKTGASKLKIKEMGSRYLFIVLYIWLEKMLSRGDYNRVQPDS